MFAVARRSFSVISLRGPSLLLHPTTSETRDPLVYAQHSRLNDLDYALKNNASPSHVWANYTNLLNVVNNNNIPLEIHQQVLRRCTPSSQELRIAVVRRLQANNVPATPHIHEDRFRAIMRNIRILGVHPSLDDYHFVLEQFAAVGHFMGSIHVYKELRRIGHTPNHKTFGLCLQSIAHRFTLPIPKSQRLTLPIQAREMFNNYMADMRDQNVPLTPVNLDMMLRILKETLDLDGFESLMRWGYGIDLSNPDRIALEYTRAGDGPLIPFPFTTTSLNTTIDMLGRSGNISKLVQAFEVLTQPLPEASRHSFNAFEEDDDFGVSVDVSSSARFPPPYACPNTTTYNMLLRHICRAGHSILARHYILQAIYLDRQTDKRLRQTVCRWNKRMQKAILQPLNQVPAPHFSINRQLLLSVMGEGNVDKDLGLLRWLYTKLPYIIRKKTNDLEHYTSLRQAYAESAQLPAGASKHSPPPTPSPPSTDSTIPELFDLDLEDSTPPETPRIKYFNLDLHVRILTRNLFEIKDFARRLEFVLGRTTERVKERLGRRVWAGKDIYLSTEVRRVNQTREAWKTIVNFQPRRDSYPNQRQDQRRGRLRNRSMSTLSYPYGSARIVSDQPVVFMIPCG